MKERGRAVLWPLHSSLHLELPHWVEQISWLQSAQRGMCGGETSSRAACTKCKIASAIVAVKVSMKKKKKKWEHNDLAKDIVLHTLADNSRGFKFALSSRERKFFLSLFLSQETRARQSIISIKCMPMLCDGSCDDDGGKLQRKWSTCYATIYCSSLPSHTHTERLAHSLAVCYYRIIVQFPFERKRNFFSQTCVCVRVSWAGGRLFELICIMRKRILHILSDWCAFHLISLLAVNWRGENNRQKRKGTAIQLNSHHKSLQLFACCGCCGWCCYGDRAELKRVNRVIKHSWKRNKANYVKQNTSKRLPRRSAESTTADPLTPFECHLWPLWCWGWVVIGWLTRQVTRNKEDSWVKSRTSIE